MTIKSFKKRLKSLNYTVFEEGKRIIVKPIRYYCKNECKKHTKVLLSKYKLGYHKYGSDINHNALKIIMKFARTPIQDRHYEKDFGKIVTINQLYDIISHHYGNLKIDTGNWEGYPTFIIKTPSDEHDIVIKATKSGKSTPLSDLKNQNLKKLLSTFINTPVLYRGYAQYRHNPAGRDYLEKALKNNNAVKTTPITATNTNNQAKKITLKHSKNYHAKTEVMQWTSAERNYFAWLRKVGDADGNKIYGKTDADTVHDLIEQDLKADEDNSHVKF